MSREHKTRVEAVLARIAIVGFAALSAFYSLYVSWAGRLNVETGEPDGLVRALSGLLLLRALTLTDVRNLPCSALRRSTLLP